VLRFDSDVQRLGTTSFTMHQTATRDSDDELVAEAEFVFVCVTREGKPTPVPEEVARFLGAGPSARPSAFQNVSIRGVATGVDEIGDGDAVLFVHGFPLDRTMWSEIAGTLTGWRRIAPDLRGFGVSEGPDGGYTMAEYADDLAALLDLLEIEDVLLCGLSMGGYVAFEFLRRHRERVRGLMLLNTRADQDDDVARANRNETITAIRRSGVGVLEDLLLHRLLAPDTIETMPHVVERLRRILGRHSTEGITGALEAMRDRSDSTPLLPSIDVPTLVVAGREDRLVSVESSQRLAAAIPGAQFTAIAEAGHLTPMEQPISTARVLREFLDSIKT
jgi:pimeloyl-ACP methyl ester carboxylesterase